MLHTSNTLSLEFNIAFIICVHAHERVHVHHVMTDPSSYTTATAAAAPPGDRRRLTVLDLADVADDDVADRYLVEVAAADDGELVLVLDLVLQTAELLLLAPVVEGGDEHDDDHRQQDGHALDPARLLLVPAVAH